MRIDDDGAGAHLAGEVKNFAGKLVEELAAAQVVVIRLGIVGLLAGYGLFFLRRELDAQSLADAASDFVLDFEDVFQLAIVAFRPDGVTRLSADELRGDAQAIAGATQAAAEDARGVEFAADLGPGYGLVAIGQDGGAGEDLELFDLGKLGDDVFGHAIAEVFVVFAVAEIFEIEDGDGFFRGGRGGLGGGGTGLSLGVGEAAGRIAVALEA